MVFKGRANGSATGLGLEIEKELLNEMPFLNITFKIEKDLKILTKELKMDMIGLLELWLVMAKKIGSKLVSLAHFLFLDEGFLQQSPWTKGSRLRNFKR